MAVRAWIFLCSLIIGGAAAWMTTTTRTTTSIRARTPATTCTQLFSMFDEQNNNIRRFPKDYGNTLFRNRDSSPDAYYRNDDDVMDHRYDNYNGFNNDNYNGYHENNFASNTNTNTINNNNHRQRQGGRGQPDYYDSERNGVGNAQLSYRDEPEGNDRYIDYFYNERGMHGNNNINNNNNNRMPTMSSRRRPPPPGDGVLDVLRENDRLFEELWRDTSRIFDKLNRILGMRGPPPAMMDPFSNMPPMMMPPPPPPPAASGIDELLHEAERALNTDPACRDVLGERIQIGEIFTQDSSSSSLSNGRQEMTTELEFAVQGRMRSREPGVVQLLATERGIEEMTLRVPDERAAGGFREIFVQPPPPPPHMSSTRRGRRRRPLVDEEEEEQGDVVDAEIVQ